MHGGFEGNVGRRNKEEHDYNAKEDGGFAQLAFGWAAKAKVVTTATFGVFALAFAVRDIGCNSGPGGEPEDYGQGVEGRKRVNVCVARGAGPHRGCDEVDQDRDREPALRDGISCAGLGMQGRAGEKVTDKGEEPACAAICRAGGNVDGDSEDPGEEDGKGLGGVDVVLFLGQGILLEPHGGRIVNAIR